MKIALISDIHFGAYSRTREFSVPGEEIDDETKGGPSLKEGLIDLLKKQRVKYIFIAGDLTSVGSPQEFWYCQKQILELAESTGVSQNNVICCLGNHDIDWKVAKLCESIDGNTPTTEVEELVREKYQLIASNVAVNCLDKIPQPINKGIAPYSGVIATDDFVVFVLNTAWYCSYDEKIPHGKLHTKQLEWFSSIAKDYEADKRTKIVLMHHHPMQYAYPNPVHDISMMEEGSEFTEICGKNGINLIMHGHRHHPKVITRMENNWKNPITFLCAGSLSVNAKHRSCGEIPNTVHILDLSSSPKEFILYNYEFSLSEGWHPFERNKAETPMEQKMYLGKIADDLEITKEIEKFKEGSHTLKWESLPEPLKFIAISDLNKRLKESLPDRIIYGSFPNDVYIMDKEGL